MMGKLRLELSPHKQVRAHALTGSVSSLHFGCVEQARLHPQLLLDPHSGWSPAGSHQCPSSSVLQLISFRFNKSQLRVHLWVGIK